MTWIRCRGRQACKPTANRPLLCTRELALGGRGPVCSFRVCPLQLCKEVRMKSEDHDLISDCMSCTPVMLSTPLAPGRLRDSTFLSYLPVIAVRTTPPALRSLRVWSPASSATVSSMPPTASFRGCSAAPARCASILPASTSGSRATGSPRCEGGKCGRIQVWLLSVVTI